MWRDVELWIKRLNLAAGRRFGMAIEQFPRRDSLDAELNRVINHFGVETILDIGAHAGGFAEKRRLLGYAAGIISFEPYAPSFAKLRVAAAADPRWDVHQIALGSSDGSADFHIFNGDNQLTSMRVLGSHAALFDSTITELNKIEIEVRRLDTLWPSLEANPTTTMLKIDTQGYDLEVIEGAGSLMVDIPCVLMECPVQAIYSGAPLFEDIAATMRSLGFELTGAFPIHRYEGIRVIEFDCTFLNLRR